MILFQSLQVNILKKLIKNKKESKWITRILTFKNKTLRKSLELLIQFRLTNFNHDYECSYTCSHSHT